MTVNFHALIKVAVVCETWAAKGRFLLRWCCQDAPDAFKNESKGRKTQFLLFNFHHVIFGGVLRFCGIKHAGPLMSRNRVSPQAPFHRGVAVINNRG